MTGQHGVRSLAVAFAALGGTASVIPAVIPAMAADLGVASSALLPAIPALFTGLLFGVLATSLSGGRVSLPWLLRGGAAAQAIGLCLAACAPAPFWFVAGAAMAGFGFGIVEAAGTAAVRVIGAGGMPRALTTLTLFIGIVATVTPIAVLAAATLGWARPIPLLIALVQLGVAASMRGIPAAVPAITPAAAATSRPTSASRSRQIALLAAALFCYVGTESVLSGWSASTFERELGASAAVAALGTSAFWLLMSLGRMAGVAGTGRIPPGRVVLGSTLVIAASLCAAAVLQNTHPLLAMVGWGIAVFAAGPCYGLLIGIAVERTPKRSAVRASAGFVALGAAGGAVIPFIAASVSLSSGTGSATTTAAIAGTALCLLVVASRAWCITPAAPSPIRLSAGGER